MLKSVSSLFFKLSRALEHYSNVTPSYKRIQNLYNNNLEPDHIAMRSFKCCGGIDSIKQELIEDNIYHSGGTLSIPEKHLNAEWFYTTHPEFRKLTPRIFISEIDDSLLSQESQSILHKYATSTEYIDLCLDDYLKMAEDSEYASWTMAHETQINHLALNIPTDDTVSQFLDNLEDNKFIINTIGGRIKTSSDGMLHQGSTMSDTMLYPFENGREKQIPAFFVEFVQRDKYPNGSIREGFEANNALHIFDSTSSTSSLSDKHT